MKVSRCKAAKQKLQLQMNERKNAATKKSEGQLKALEQAQAALT